MRKWLLIAIATAFLSLAGVSAGFARQQPGENRDPSAPDAPKPSANGTLPDKPDTPDQKTNGGTAPTLNPAAPGVHRFWDRENDLLFAAVGAGRALDYASTLNLRHRGINEAFLTNSIVDNHPLFAGIEIAADAFRCRQNKQNLKTLTEFIEDGKITPVIDRRYPFEEIPAAVRYQEEGHAPGKVVIAL